MKVCLGLGPRCGVFVAGSRCMNVQGPATQLCVGSLWSTSDQKRIRFGVSKCSPVDCDEGVMHEQCVGGRKVNRELSAWSTAGEKHGGCVEESGSSQTATPRPKRRTSKSQPMAPRSRASSSWPGVPGWCRKSRVRGPGRGICKMNVLIRK